MKTGFTTYRLFCVHCFVSVFSKCRCAYLKISVLSAVLKRSVKWKRKHFSVCLKQKPLQTKTENGLLITDHWIHNAAKAELPSRPFLSHLQRFKALVPNCRPRTSRWKAREIFKLSQCVRLCNNFTFSGYIDSGGIFLAHTLCSTSRTLSGNSARRIYTYQVRFLFGALYMRFFCRKQNSGGFAFIKRR